MKAATFSAATFYGLLSLSWLPNHTIIFMYTRHPGVLAPQKIQEHSKRINPFAESDAETFPKRKKISSEIHVKQIAAIRERTADTNDQLGFHYHFIS